MTEAPLHSQLTNLSINSSVNENLKRIDELTIKELDVLKRDVEAELDKYFSIINDHNITMDSPLLTRDGYPRSDIDVLQIRLVRRNINILRNDLNKVINASFSKINEHFEKVEKPTSKSSGDYDNYDDYDSVVPFALLEDVVGESPAALAGCLQGDKLVSLGNLNAGNYSNLQNISRYILQNENKKVLIKVKRGDHFFKLALIPTRNWNGQGLLGCKLKLL